MTDDPMLTEEFCGALRDAVIRKMWVMYPAEMHKTKVKSRSLCAARVVSSCTAIATKAELLLLEAIRRKEKITVNLEITNGGGSISITYDMGKMDSDDLAVEADWLCLYIVEMVTGSEAVQDELNKMMRGDSENTRILEMATWPSTTGEA